MSIINHKNYNNMSKIKIDVKQEVTSVLPFMPFPEFNNLCLGFLTAVEYDETEAKDSQWEYAGQTVPKLTFRFVQYKAKADDKDRVFSHRELPIATIKVSGEEVTDANLVLMYTEMWKRIKHIHDQYVDSPNYKEIKSIPEFDAHASLNERLATFTKFFKQMADAFNKGKDKETPIYLPHGAVGADKTNLLAMKLIAGGRNNGTLVFPTFVGTGFVEQAKFKGPKLDSILVFKAKETVELGSATANPAGAVAAQSDISAQIADQLLQ